VRQHEFFCLGDPNFYEPPIVGSRAPDFDAALLHLPEGWNRAEFGDWITFRPTAGALPLQGWKIHASASPQNAEGIADAVRDYCFKRNIAFKFLRSRQLLFLRNSKAADRSASGKFVTIYPRDEAELERTLVELDELIGGREGPYILSDLRWHRGPLYVRYGGFAVRWIEGQDGERVAAIERPDGQLVPDRRLPTFEVPDWVTLPRFLEPHLEARNSQSLENIPYAIEGALHFSNAGGIYLARDKRTGEQVVLKEARPLAGLTRDDVDAVTRLRHEHSILQRLTGIAEVAQARDYFVAGDSHFLVLDFVDGDTVNAHFVGRFPLVEAGATDSKLKAHADWVRSICAKVEAAIEKFHERGIVIGDLHPSNIILTEEGDIRFIDWETATLVDDRERPSLGTPDFTAPSDRRGVDVDLYALASLRLFLFLPLTALIKLRPQKAQALGEEILEEFPTDRAFIDKAVDTLAGGSLQSRQEDRWLSADLSTVPWEELRDSAVAGILASATPERKDRLFPGDIAQFEGLGGIDIATGAAGVLYALHSVGAELPASCREWLIERAIDPAPDQRSGLYDGLHGVAFVLDFLGHREEALKVLELGLADKSGGGRSIDLHSGAAGIGLNLAHFASATGDAGMEDLARRHVERVADVLERSPGDGEASAGLMHGASGPALLFIRWFERTGDAAYLDLARKALQLDLDRCVRTREGVLHVNEGWRTMPYLASGSAGIGIVLDKYLRHRADEHFTEAETAIHGAALSRFYVQSGLFAGRAGMMLYISHRRSAGQDKDALKAHIRRLSSHSLSCGGNLAFPGNQLLRLSMDFSTGAAGVIFAIAAVLTDRNCRLPLVNSDQFSAPGGTYAQKL
jgi:serine/threonine protein kinase